jgi:hypothetical protein
MVDGIMTSLAGEVAVVPVDNKGSDGVTDDTCKWPAGGNGQTAGEQKGNFNEV